MGWVRGIACSRTPVTLLILHLIDPKEVKPLQLCGSNRKEFVHPPVGDARCCRAKQEKSPGAEALGAEGWKIQV
jgi:hypothetical protein